MLPSRKSSQEMRRPDFDVLLLAPLLGLRTPSEKGSIRGVMETEIGRMTDGEIISSLHWGMLSYPMSDVVMHVPYASAIRVRGKLKRLIGDPTRGLASGEATEWEEAAHARIDEVLDSFRVFKPGRIRHAGAMLFMSGWPVSGALDWPGFSAVRGISGSTRPFMHWPADYELASDEMGRSGIGIFGDDLVRTAAECLRVVVAHASLNTGVRGDALVRCSLIFGTGPAQLGYAHYHDEWEQYEPSRPIAARGAPVGTPRGIDIDAVLNSPAEWMSATRLMSTDLFHAFGQPEVLQITESGAFNTNYWRPNLLDGWKLVEKVPRVSEQIRFR